MATYTHKITHVCNSQSEYDTKLALANAYDAGPGANLTARTNDEPNLTIEFTIPAQPVVL